MRKLAAGLAVAVVLVVASTVVAVANDAAVVLKGTWWSSVDSRWGGALKIALAPGHDGQLSGTVHFYNSGCPRETPFQGLKEGDKLVLVAQLGTPCGRVRLVLVPDEDGYRGSYEAEFPDRGSVRVLK
jgi:hypothetical protein